MKKNEPFLSFYQEHKISPVRQDISDLSKHFSRRSALYQHLGIIPNLLHQKDILEFGPGGGYNSIFTASLKPKKYVLVDANPTGLQSTKELLQPYKTALVDIEIHESNALNFSIDQTFDLVIAEGLVQLQLDPSSFACKLAEHTKLGGVFILTTSDHISFFSEALRRLLAALISPTSDPLEKRINALLPIFENHAKTLEGMSRPVEDWLIDTIIIPFEGNLFSFPDAINTLENNFDFYNSSPKFTTDWRWYKDINKKPLGFNELAIESYYQHLHNFLDYRSVSQPRDKKANLELKSLCIDVYETEQKFEMSNEPSLINEVLQGATSVSSNIKHILPETAEAINEFVLSIKKYQVDKNIPELNKFKALFGRSMQYASFIRVR